MVTPTPKKPTVNYSRKTKSLGLLAENFISTYSTTENAPISIDHAAKHLGVERRRIYDIINIFESLDIVQRKCKNTYDWMGVQHLPQVFGKFQQDAFLEFTQEAIENGLYQGASLNPRQVSTPLGQKKSLGKLSQQFVQLFLVGRKIMNLKEVSDKILGTTTENIRGLKTKIRRLYDIANVFLSLGLVQKLEGETRRDKPNFCWAYELSPREIRELYLKQESTIMSMTNVQQDNETTGAVALVHVSSAVAQPTPSVDTATTGGVPAVQTTATPPLVAPAVNATGHAPVLAATTSAATPSIETLVVAPAVHAKVAAAPSVQQTLGVTAPCVEFTTPAVKSVPTTMVAAAVTQEEPESRDDVASSSCQEMSSDKATRPSGTPVCDKTVLANINAMGGAEYVAAQAEICRTVSISPADMSDV